jgi:hypothetical protein
MAAATRRPTGGAKAAPKGSTRAAAEPPAPPPCPVALCPVCLTVTALGEIRPELVEHLLVAGREVLLAMRTVIDARLEETERPVRLQRLTIE